MLHIIYTKLQKFCLISITNMFNDLKIFIYLIIFILNRPLKTQKKILKYFFVDSYNNITIVIYEKNIVK